MTLRITGASTAMVGTQSGTGLTEPGLGWRFGPLACFKASTCSVTQGPPICGLSGLGFEAQPTSQILSVAGVLPEAGAEAGTRARAVTRIKAQPAPRITLGRPLLGFGCKGDRRALFQHGPALGPTLDFPSSGSPGGFLGLPRGPLLPLSFWDLWGFPARPLL